MKKADPKFKTTILEVVNTQLKSGDPPETRQTFNRLIGEGISEEAAKIYIGQAIVVEIFNILKHGEVFNLGRYRKNLSRLPKDTSE
ncbi:MAG: hypothetical protein NTU59_00725 [Coprothermobacterota bacterium]|nr:hypothetical protein [Coprothermobacterota bacterium]